MATICPWWSRAPARSDLQSSFLDTHFPPAIIHAGRGTWRTRASSILTEAHACSRNTTQTELVARSPRPKATSRLSTPPDFLSGRVIHNRWRLPRPMTSRPPSCRASWANPRLPWTGCPPGPPRRLACLAPCRRPSGLDTSHRAVRLTASRPRLRRQPLGVRLRRAQSSRARSNAQPQRMRKTSPGSVEVSHDEARHSHRGARGVEQTANRAHGGASS